MRSLPLLLVLLSAIPAAAAPTAPPAPDAPTAGPPGALAGDKHDHKDDEDEAPVPPNESLQDYFWRKSDVAFHAGDYERAIGLHRAIVVVDPTDVESYSVGSWLIWSLGRKDEAVDFIKKGLAANPKDPEMWDAAGQHYDLQKRFADSKQSYGKAVELAGKDAPEMLRRRYAHACEHSGDLESSAMVWRQLVKDYPNDVVDKNNLARVEKALVEKKAPTASTRS